MTIILQQLPEGIKGIARSKLLAQEAAVSLKTLEKDTDGLVYMSLWHDATDTLLAKRLRVAGHLPGYDPHNFGLALALNGAVILSTMKISYEDLLYVMKRRGWYCHRRDGAVDEPGSFQFLFLGDGADEYLQLASFDPLSWDKPIEKKIHDKHFRDFALSPAQVQSHLLALGFFHGTVDGNYDGYMREAIMAFQRAWNLNEGGTITPSLQRSLAFVGTTIEVISG